MSYRDEVRRQLDHFLTDPLPPELAGPFATGSELLGAVKHATPPECDALLLPIIRAYQQGAREAASILLAASWRHVSALYHWRIRGRFDRSFGDDRWRDESFAKVVTAFYSALEKYPLANRPSRVTGNLWGLTLHELTKHEEDEKNQAKTREEFLDAFLALSDETGHWDFRRLPGESEKPAPYEPAELVLAENFLAALLPDPRDRTLLIEVHVQGRKINEVGAQLGLSPAASWQRILRAERRVRRYRADAGGRKTVRNSLPKGIDGVEGEEK